MTIGHDAADFFDRLFYPVDLAHEFAHGGIARAFGGRFALARRHDGRLGVDVEFDEDVSTLALVLTSLAPTLLGLPLVLFLLDGLGDALLGTTGLLEGLVAVVAFAIAVRFTWPSIADLAVPIALASDELGGGPTVRKHEVALLVGTVILASVTFLSIIQGTIFAWAWYHFIGLVGVAAVAFYMFEEWRRVEVPSPE